MRGSGSRSFCCTSVSIWDVSCGRKSTRSQVWACGTQFLPPKRSQAGRDWKCKSLTEEGPGQHANPRWGWYILQQGGRRSWMWQTWPGCWEVEDAVTGRENGTRDWLLRKGQNLEHLPASVPHTLQDKVQTPNEGLPRPSPPSLPHSPSRRPGPKFPEPNTHLLYHSSCTHHPWVKFPLIWQFSGNTASRKPSSHRANDGRLCSELSWKSLTRYTGSSAFFRFPFVLPIEWHVQMVAYVTLLIKI